MVYFWLGIFTSVLTFAWINGLINNNTPLIVFTTFIGLFVISACAYKEGRKDGS